MRAATLDDVDALVHHRLSMFSEMGTPFDAPIIREMFRDWLLQKMPSGDYLAWVAAGPGGEVVAGAGILLHAWCADKGIGAVALNAAPAARHLYESQGYRPAPSPMMWKIT